MGDALKQAPWINVKNGIIKNTEGKDNMADFTWSYSSLKQYENCPKQYYEVKVLQNFITENNRYHIESANNKLLVFRYFRLMSIGEIEELISFAQQLSTEFQKCLATPSPKL